MSQPEVQNSAQAAGKNRAEIILAEISAQLAAARLRYKLKAPFFLALQILGWISVLFWLYLFAITFSISELEIVAFIAERTGNEDLRQITQIISVWLNIIRIVLLIFISCSMAFIYLAGKVRKRGLILQPYIERLRWEETLNNK